MVSTLPSNNSISYSISFIIKRKAFLFSNILNNNEIAIFSSIMGSNIGALLTPIGALAGIMWMSLLKEKRIEMNFFKFIKYCAPICLISSFLGFIVLAFYF